jgi:hypothetical protein
MRMVMELTSQRMRHKEKRERKETPMLRIHQGVTLAKERLMKSWRVTKNPKIPRQTINTFYTPRVNDFGRNHNRGGHRKYPQH